MKRTTNELAKDLLAIINSQKLKIKKSNNNLEITIEGQTHILPTNFSKLTSENVQINR
jgi:hypothetical protein